jgi:hypothetical protein
MRINKYSQRIIFLSIYDRMVTGMSISKLLTMKGLSVSIKQFVLLPLMKRFKMAVKLLHLEPFLGTKQFHEFSKTNIPDAGVNQ